MKRAASNFLPPRLRPRRDIELTATERGRFHDLSRAAVNAMQRGDVEGAARLAVLAARVAREGAR